ncbi:MAG: DUF3109 family protein [Bacteroidota bacterium]|nr:DUF3109 family protein [Bacteroidota bacterium]
MPESLNIDIPIYPPSARFEVDARLGEVEFACDLSICKGACCTMPGGRGAPVLKAEISELERAFPIVSKYLPEKALEAIAEQGIWRNEIDGTFTISTIGRRECIFVHWENDIAFCSIQTAFRKGEIQGFEKPISCHLFPIRIYPERKKDTFFICYEEIDECEGGRVNGKKVHMPLLEFLRSPLARALGKERTELLIQSFKEEPPAA